VNWSRGTVLELHFRYFLDKKEEWMIMPRQARMKSETEKSKQSFQKFMEVES